MSDWPAATSDTLDVECIACGYNLRGLDQAGRCPECGEAIDATFRAIALGHGNPFSFSAATVQWRRRFRLGMHLVFWPILASQGMNLFLHLVTKPASRTVHWSIFVAVSVMQLALTAGVILTASPRRLPRRRWHLLRWFVILSSVLGFVGSTAMWLIFDGLLKFTDVGGLVAWLGLIVQAATTATWWYWSQVVPDVGRSTTRQLRIAGVVLLGVACATYWVNGVATRTNTRAFAMPYAMEGYIKAIYIIVPALLYRFEATTGLVVFGLAALISLVAVVSTGRLLWFVHRVDIRR